MGIYWGSAIRPDYAVGSPAEAAYAALESARAEFRVCNDYSHSDELTRVEIMSAGSIGGDTIDESNSAALEAMARAWIDDDRAEGDGSDVDYHARAATIAVCVTPGLIDAELLAEIISAAESFADYPVLDESDYYERESAEWTEALEWATRDVPEEHRPAVAAFVNEHRYGYAERGYVADEWVTEALQALGLTRRRVRATFPLQWAVTLHVLGTDRDGELAWLELGHVPTPGRR